MIKKLYTLIITSLILILSMSVSVFAWFTYKHYDTVADDLTGETSTIIPIPEGDREFVEIYSGDKLEFLTYLSKEDFNNDQGAHFVSGYASVVKITLENSNEIDIKTNLQLKTIHYPEYGELSGSISSLKYLIVAEDETFESIYQDVVNYDIDRSFYHNINGYNIHKEINIEAMEGNNPTTKDVYVYIWGDFDSLTEHQKHYMQSVAYRILLSLRLK